jgi:hypothetical protein
MGEVDLIFLLGVIYVIGPFQVSMAGTTMG